MVVALLAYIAYSIAISLVSFEIVEGLTLIAELADFGRHGCDNFSIFFFRKDFGNGTEGIGDSGRCMRWAIKNGLQLSIQYNIQFNFFFPDSPARIFFAMIHIRRHRHVPGFLV